MIATNANTPQATPARKTARATQYQTRLGRSFAGGRAAGATADSSPSPPGGIQDVAMTVPPIRQLTIGPRAEKNSKANGPDAMGPWSFAKPPQSQNATLWPHKTPRYWTVLEEFPLTPS